MRKLTPEKVICLYALIADPVECKTSALNNSRDTTLAQDYLLPFIFNLFHFKTKKSVAAHQDDVEKVLKYIFLTQKNYYWALRDRRLVETSQDIFTELESKGAPIEVDELFKNHQHLLDLDGVKPPSYLAVDKMHNLREGWYKPLFSEFTEFALLKKMHDETFEAFKFYHEVVELVKRYAQVSTRSCNDLIIGEPTQVNIELMDFFSHYATAVALAARREWLLRSGEAKPCQIAQKTELMCEHLQGATRHLEKSLMDIYKIIIATLYNVFPLENKDILTIQQLRHDYCHMHFSAVKKDAYRVLAMYLRGKCVSIATAV